MNIIIMQYQTIKSVSSVASGVLRQHDLELHKIRDLFKVKLYAIRSETKREREREREILNVH